MQFLQVCREGRAFRVLLGIIGCLAIRGGGNGEPQGRQGVGKGAQRGLHLLGEGCPAAVVAGNQGVVEFLGKVGHLHVVILGAAQLPGALGSQGEGGDG